jgi:hypothetical protein
MAPEVKTIEKRSALAVEKEIFFYTFYGRKTTPTQEVLRYLPVYST